MEKGVVEGKGVVEKCWGEVFNTSLVEVRVLWRSAVEKF